MWSLNAPGNRKERKFTNYYRNTMICKNETELIATTDIKTKPSSECKITAFVLDYKKNQFIFL